MCRGGFSTPLYFAPGTFKHIQLFHVLRCSFWLKGVGVEVVLNAKTFTRDFALFPLNFSGD